MEIILIDDVFELGKRGDVVRVANGSMVENYLIPKNLAVPATPGNRKMVDQQTVGHGKKRGQVSGGSRAVSHKNLTNYT